MSCTLLESSIQVAAHPGRQRLEREVREDRPMVPVKDAADRLGCTRSWIHQMLDSPNHPLEGPPSPGRGRGRERQVYVDTIDLQRARMRWSKRAREPSDPQMRLARLEERIFRLEAAAFRQRGGVESAHPAAVEQRDLRWTLLQLNAATDELRTALMKESEVRAFQQDAILRLSEALAVKDQVAASLRRSDQLRSEVIGVLLAPSDVDDLK